MKILLCNDDGINAPGIRCLAKQLCKNNEVYIVAPENQMSGASHSATYFHHSLNIKEYDIKGVKCAYSVEGTPVDCVYTGLKFLVKDKIDLVISGINQGWNVALDNFYSGTVGAAREGLFLGVPAIAASLGSYTEAKFDVASKIVESLIPKYLSDKNCKEYILNVNIPLLEEDKIKGFKVIGSEPNYQYNDNFKLNKSDDGYILDIISNEGHRVKDDVIRGDASACKNGYVSITPLTLNMDDTAKIDYLKDIFK